MLPSATFVLHSCYVDRPRSEPKPLQWDSS